MKSIPSSTHLKQTSQSISHDYLASWLVPKQAVRSELMSMTNTQMTLHGSQIHVDTETGAAMQYLQDWMAQFGK